MPSRAVLRLAGSKGFKTEYDLAVLFNVSIDAVHWKLVSIKELLIMEDSNRVKPNEWLADSPKKK